MKFVFICLLLTGFSPAISSFAENPAQHRSWIAWFKIHDPVVDAKSRVEVGDVFVLSAMGVGYYYPGISSDEGQKIEKKYSAKPIKDMFDVVKGDLHMAYMDAAAKYASFYNKEVLRLLREKGKL